MFSNIKELELRIKEKIEKENILNELKDLIQATWNEPKARRLIRNLKQDLELIENELIEQRLNLKC